MAQTTSKLTEKPVGTALRLVLAAAGVLLGASALAADGDIWSFEDSDGVPHFSNVPDNSRYRPYLKAPEVAAAKTARGNALAASRTKSPPVGMAGPGQLPFADIVTAAATAQKLDPALLHAIIHVESRHNPAALSAKGAVGLMQVLPQTASRMGVADVGTPAGNVSAGARYLRFLLDAFGQDVQLALAAYNAGENAVSRYGNRIPPYRETLAYVPAVIAAYDELRQRDKR